MQGREKILFSDVRSKIPSLQYEHQLINIFHCLYITWMMVTKNNQCNTKHSASVNRY